MWWQASIKTIDHVDLLREQLKILSGEVALHTSVLKRLSEEAANSPKKEQIQVIFYPPALHDLHKYTRHLISHLFVADGNKED